MSITSLAIKRPILFIVFYLLLIGLGVFSYKQLKFELLPELATPFVVVVTQYPGASPKEVENSVTKKIEDAVAEVSKVKKVTAASSENVSVVTLEFLPSANADQAAQDVQRAVSKVVSEFTSGIKNPSIEKFNINDLPVLRVGVTSSASEEELFELVKNQIKPSLSQIKSVGRVSLMGGAEKEVKIWMDNEQLVRYNLALAEVMEVIQKANQDVPVGKVKDTDAQFTIRLAGKVNEIEQMLNQDIKVLADGSKIKVKDVAKIYVDRKEFEVVNRLDMKPSVGLFVGKRTGSNAVEVSESVRKQFENLEKEYAHIQLKFEIAQDTSEFTLKAAEHVFDDFIIALILVALVMLVFLHSIRNAAIVMLAIPTSLASAFIMMFFFDYSLNLMTLLAMSLVIGILVDDSIVVLENIYRHLEMGKDKVQASLDGRNEIGFSALSITLVDVVVFLPMALVPGLVGSLVKQFSLVIVVSTLSSLVVSFTLTPMISSRFAQLTHLKKGKILDNILLFFERQIESLTKAYEGILVWSLKHKVATVSIALGLLFASLGLAGFGFIGSEFAPATDKGEMSLFISMPQGTSLGKTDAIVKNIENRIKQIPEVTKTFTSVGYQNDGFNDNFAPNLAAVSISLKSSEQRTKTINELAREVKTMAMQYPGVKARVSPIGLFGAQDAPIQILISNNDRDYFIGRVKESRWSFKSSTFFGTRQA
jgi:multidrug efflux pump subunit AcrB